jgi:isocitrate dehydrogenase (NAD+)
MLTTKLLKQNRAKLMTVASRNFAGKKREDSIYEHGDFLHPTYLPRPGAGKSKVVGLVPGNGIGSLLIDSVENIFRHVDVKVTFENFGDIRTEDKVAMDHLSKCDAVLKGPFNENEETKEDIFLAQKMDLYAYVVHAFSIPGIKTRHQDLDVVLIRENSEGEYSTIEHEVLDGVVESIKVTTKEKSMRIAEYAFEYANISNKRKVTCIHKANIIKKGDGDFLNAAREVSERYPRVKLEEMIVDAACMNMVTYPNQFEVVLLPNLYGSIIGNVLAGIVGGAGIAPGASIGHELGMFEQGAR